MKRRLRYSPKRDQSYYLPGLTPGQVVEVDDEEAERLIATGLFVEIKERGRRKEEEDSDG